MEFKKIIYRANKKGKRLYKRAKSKTKDMATFLKNGRYMEKTIDYLYRSKDIKPIIYERNYSEGKSSFTVRVPPGLSFKELEDKKSHFEDCTGKRVVMEKHGKNLEVRILHGDLKSIYYYDFNPKVYTDKVLPFPAGIDLNGELQVGDLAEFYHLLIGGNTGNGKSNFIRNLIVSFLLGNHPVEMVIIDPKRVDFSSFLGDRVTIFKDMGAEVPAFKELKKRLDKRTRLLESKGLDTILDIQEKERPPIIVTIIDEIHDMEDKQSQKILWEILRKGRAAGMWCICATQRPDANTFVNFPALKALMGGRICFKTVDGINSEIILGRGNTKGSTLTKRGRAIFQHMEDMEVQTFLLPKNLAKKLLKGKEVLKFEYEHEERLLPRPRNNKVNREKQGPKHRPDTDNVLSFEARRKDRPKKTKETRRKE